MWNIQIVDVLLSWQRYKSLGSLSPFPSNSCTWQAENHNDSPNKTQSGCKSPGCKRWLKCFPLSSMVLQHHICCSRYRPQPFDTDSQRKCPLDQNRVRHRENLELLGGCRWQPDQCTYSYTHWTVTTLLHQWTFHVPLVHDTEPRHCAEPSCRRVGRLLQQWCGADAISSINNK